MRICITNPRWETTQGRGIRAGCRVPNIIGLGEQSFIPFPFLLAYSAAILKQSGHDVLLIDAIAEHIDEETYVRRISEFKPGLIINEMSAASYFSDLETAKMLKKITGSQIAVCGPHPSAINNEVLRHDFIDFVLIGEMELTALELSNRLQSGGPFTGIKGLAYRSPNGDIITEERRPLIQDLDSIPYPEREGLPLKEYRVAGYRPPVLFMYSSRGCPFKCNYCLWPQTMYSPGSYRMRAPDNVVREIKHAVERYGPFNSIYFDDDTFNIDKERMMLFADKIRGAGLRIPWGCNARADLFDSESVKHLADSGLFNLRIGVESGDPEILRRAGKDLDLDKVINLVKMAHDNRIKVHATFTIGLAGESWDSVERTIAFAKSMNADSIAFTITTPFPGTAYYDQAVNAGFVSCRDWNDFNVVHSSVVRTEKMTAEEITEAERYAMKKVYMSLPFVVKRLRYSMSVNELLALFRKGLRLIRGRQI